MWSRVSASPPDPLAYHFIIDLGVSSASRLRNGHGEAPEEEMHV